MFRKLLGMFGLLFAAGCCCVGKKVVQEPVQYPERWHDVWQRNYEKRVREAEEQDKSRINSTEEKVWGGIAP